MRLLWCVNLVSTTQNLLKSHREVAFFLEYSNRFANFGMHDAALWCGYQ